LILDRVILHTVVHHSSTSTYEPNFTEIEEPFVDGRTYGQTFETGFITSTLSKSRHKKCCCQSHRAVAELQIHSARNVPHHKPRHQYAQFTHSKHMSRQW